MSIYITPLERIRTLQRENARLRALVGEPAPVETVDEEQEPTPTLIEKTDDLETAMGLLSEVIL